MSESDILSVRLFLGAAAIAFMAIAISAAGWNHKYFIRSTFALAGATAIVAIFYRSVQTFIPDRWEDLIISTVNDHRAWFFMFVVGIAAVLLVTKIPRYDLGFSLEKDPTSGLLGLQTFPSGVVFIQIHVRSKRKLANCRAWIQPVEYKMSGGNYDSEHKERLPCQWSWSGTPDPLVCDVDGPASSAINVAKIVSGALQLDPRTPTNLLNFLQRPGIHRFTVHVVGYVGRKTRSETRKILVDWNGSNTPNISLE